MWFNMHLEGEFFFFGNFAANIFWYRAIGCLFQGVKTGRLRFIFFNKQMLIPGSLRITSADSMNDISYSWHL